MQHAPALSYDRVPSPLGEILVVTRAASVVGLDFADGEQRLKVLLSRRLGVLEYESVHDPLGLRSILAAYFSGDFAAFDGVTLDAGGTPFEANAWRALRAIPAGKTRSYGEQARAVGAPRAVRAIGAANGRNPISIAIPCHRVIGANGTLTGYAGGIARKRWLLAHEGAIH